MTVDEEKTRYFNRLDSREWYTVYPSGGYWESDTRVRDDVVFEIVDNDGNLLFTESNAGPKTFCTAREKAKKVATEYAEKLNLSTYEEWRKWLLEDMNTHGYKGYADNWLYAETGRRGCEKIAEYKHLGMDFAVYKEKMDHIICGKRWFHFYVYNVSEKRTEAVCGFIYGEEAW